MLQRAAFSFANDGKRSQERPGKCKQDCNESWDQQICASRIRIKQQQWMRHDWHGFNTAPVHQFLHRFLQGESGRAGKSLGSDGIIRTIDQNEKIRGASEQTVARIIGRNLNPDRDVSCHDFFAQRVPGRNVFCNAEKTCIFQLINKLSALRSPALIKHRRRNMLDVCIDQTEKQQLKHRNDQCESQCSLIARHLERLFFQDCRKADHGTAPAARG